MAITTKEFLHYPKDFSVDPTPQPQYAYHAAAAHAFADNEIPWSVINTWTVGYRTISSTNFTSSRGISFVKVEDKFKASNGTEFIFVRYIEVTNTLSLNYMVIEHISDTYKKLSYRDYKVVIWSGSNTFDQRVSYREVGSATEGGVLMSADTIIDYAYSVTGGMDTVRSSGIPAGNAHSVEYFALKSRLVRTKISHYSDSGTFPAVRRLSITETALAPNLHAGKSFQVDTYAGFPNTLITGDGFKTLYPLPDQATETGASTGCSEFKLTMPTVGSVDYTPTYVSTSSTIESYSHSDKISLGGRPSFTYSPMALDDDTVVFGDSKSYSNISASFSTYIKGLAKEDIKTSFDLSANTALSSITPVSKSDAITYTPAISDDIKDLPALIDTVTHDTLTDNTTLLSTNIDTILEAVNTVTRDDVAYTSTIRDESTSIKGAIATVTVDTIANAVTIRDNINALDGNVQTIVHKDISHDFTPLNNVEVGLNDLDVDVGVSGSFNAIFEDMHTKLKFLLENNRIDYTVYAKAYIEYIPIAEQMAVQLSQLKVTKEQEVIGIKLRALEIQQQGAIGIKEFNSKETNTIAQYNNDVQIDVNKYMVNTELDLDKFKTKTSLDVSNINVQNSTDVSKYNNDVLLRELEYINSSKLEVDKLNLDKEIRTEEFNSDANTKLSMYNSNTIVTATKDTVETKVDIDKLKYTTDLKVKDTNVSYDIDISKYNNSTKLDVNKVAYLEKANNDKFNADITSRVAEFNVTTSSNETFKEADITARENAFKAEMNYKINDATERFNVDIADRNIKHSYDFNDFFTRATQYIIDGNHMRAKDSFASTMSLGEAHITQSSSRIDNAVKKINIGIAKGTAGIKEEVARYDAEAKYNASEYNTYINGHYVTANTNSVRATGYKNSVEASYIGIGSYYAAMKSCSDVNRNKAAADKLANDAIVADKNKDLIEAQVQGFKHRARNDQLKHLIDIWTITATEELDEVWRISPITDSNASYVSDRILEWTGMI